MATHSSVLAWRIPGMVEPGGLLSMGSQSRTRLKRLSSSSIDIARETYLLSRANYNRNLLELIIILFIWSLEQP